MARRQSALLRLSSTLAMRLLSKTPDGRPAHAPELIELLAELS